MQTTPLYLKLTLRQLILLLALASAFFSMINTLYAGYFTQRDLLINNTLKANQVYSTKLAENTQYFLKTTLQRLEYSAKLLADHMSEQDYLTKEVERLRLQTEGFNAVTITDAQGTVQAISPSTLLNLKGSVLNSDGAKEALKEQKPLISKPYISAANNLVIFISYPIKSKLGQFLGYIGGSIQLQKQNALYELLGEHFYRDGSFLYVLDRDGYVLYHPDNTSIGRAQPKNPALQASVQYQTGTLHQSASLIGYAHVPLAGWVIVAESPESATLQSLDLLTQTLLIKSAPVALLGFILLWYFARLISKPLWQLAKQAQNMEEKSAPEHIQHIKSWYFEAAQIKSALLMGLAALNQKIGNLAQDSMIDALTGLQNRRGLTATLEKWQAEHTPFSAIALDLDHFKRINDSYGHDIGDNVLKYLAQTMKESSRGNDILCRTGGEEFMILLPRVDLEIAKRVAERLRVRMELADIPDLEIGVTLSFGVASWQPAEGKPTEATLKMADRALYMAKEEGRNCVVSLP